MATSDCGSVTYKMEAPWILATFILFVSMINGQDFDFGEVDNRLHALGNRPDRFRFYRPYMANKDCKDESLEKRERNAKVIFTGTVRRIYDDSDHPDFLKAQVEIKRVLKGREVISQMPGVYPESNDIYWPWNRRLVVVSGLSNPKICKSFARNYDTRIFMTSEGTHRELKLNSSLIRITLDNIEHIESSIEGSKYKPKPTEAPKDPCERVFCAFGGQCVVDPQTNTGKCRCIETCSALFSPVCGSDSTSYSSECHLRKASCTSQKRIQLKYQGSCNDNVKDPCKDKKCSFGAQCVASYDGLTARCQCPERCDNYGNNDESKPICGSDGRDYPNVCEMRKVACAEMREIEVKYQVACDPCNGHHCDMYHVCQLDSKRNPVCKCPDNCPSKLEPVCGTDGKSYSSKCHLEVEACRTRRKIRVHHSRECTTGPNPCARLQCTFGEDCHVDRSGQARCICPPSCEPVQRPVCGSDGVTYDNECELHRQACLSKWSVTITLYWRCNTNSPCRDHRCHHGAVCVAEGNKASCECPSCGQEYSPVCGSNGITYNNACQLKATVCLTQTRISVAKTGPCKNVCSDVRCENYAVCEDDGLGQPSCVCSTYCRQVNKPVCGTDGVTYANECEMKVASCQRQQLIIVASEGNCDRCRNIKCKFGSRCENGRCICPSACSMEYDHVCANNGKTYDNECRMMMDACNMQTELTVEYSGECDERGFSGSGETPDQDEECNEINCRFGGICEFEINGRTTCNCDFNCNAVRDTVCGSDGNTYGNSCQLREHACKLQKDIKQVDSDYCGELVEEACDGAPAQVDPKTGQEYICDKTGQTNCPANSYCHIIDSQKSGRCCKQDEQPIRSCHETDHGCCPDQKTASPGPDNKGCPSVCRCNSLGSQGLTCDPDSGQCNCKPGVGGVRCNRCEPGYWGLPLIATGNSGCTPCSCNMYGSMRDDCEQMNGTCVCKPVGVTGKHCDICPNGNIIGPEGCSGGNHRAETCRETTCRFGASCKMVRNRPKCVCKEDCRNDRYPYTVCGTDGNTYSSGCEMKRFSCRLQTTLQVAYRGDCRRNTATPRTPSRSRKTTRHVDHITHNDRTGVTPSTPEYGWLGDMCNVDTDCVARDSYCRNGLCACTGSLVPNSKKTACEGGTYTIPSFSGINSYLQLHKINQAQRELTVEITFKALSNEGILFYAAKSSDGTGDFISLSIKDGFVEFRYDLGSGHVVLKTQHQVILNKFHKVKARRFTQEGALYFDDMFEATGKSPGGLVNLDLKTDTFLGWVPYAPPEVYENIGTAMPFSGCMESLSVTSGDVVHVYDLNAPESPDIFKSQAIAECGANVCINMPCLNGGSCMSSEQDKFMCKCPSGYSGTKCEKNSHDGHDAVMCTDQSYCHNGGTCYELPTFGGFQYCDCPASYTGTKCEISAHPDSDSITVPQFHGDSYLEIPIEADLTNSMTFEIWFLALKEDGVILYSAKKHDGVSKTYSRDFIALNLVKGFLHFTFNLGSGIANITSPNRLPLNIWHKVSISRHYTNGEMTINGGTPVTGRSQGALRILNVADSVWLGGYPGHYNSLSGVTTGLDGAIQQFYIDGNKVDNLYGTAANTRDVTNYDGPPCTKATNPCLNEGQCIPQLNKYSCGCTDKYTGKHCEILKTESMAKRPVSFDGVTNQEYNNGITERVSSQPNNRYEIHFRSLSDNGLLLLQHKSPTVEGDYLTLALRDGQVEASYNLGKEKPEKPLIIRSNVNVADGRWHTLVFTRERRKGVLSVDMENPVIGLATNGATQLDTDGRLWIGGSYTPPRGLPKNYMRGFKGCIDSVKIDEKMLDLSTDRTDGGPTQYCDLATA